jgi:hypothetical protein
MIRALALLLLSSCVSLGSDLCTEYSAAIRAAAERCGGRIVGENVCGTALWSTSNADEVNACIEWNNNSSCEELKAHPDYCNMEWRHL